MSHFSFDRLGWYRLEDDRPMADKPRFHVFNGAVRMDQIHKAKVKNCKEQTYRSILVANNYVSLQLLEKNSQNASKMVQNGLKRLKTH